MPPVLICFSHLRWDFVFQRPNHLMVRAAQSRRVVFVEEPVHVPADDGAPRLEATDRDGVVVLTPHLPAGTAPDADVEHAQLRDLLDRYLAAERIDRPVLWYYTPMALAWTAHLAAAAVVYDCMDHLAGFRGAPAGLLEQEARLIARADLLLTGGARLHELKRRDHANAHCFPSSVDAAHFGSARGPLPVPRDQARIPGPRLGYAGVIDERLDLGLVAHLSQEEPDWNVVLVGPVVKIDVADLPSAPNIHHLGMREYRELPRFLAGWDAALMPFAHNESTAYISPTKTPEYLAAGLPVASTSIHDVVQPYGSAGLVEVGDGPEGFLAACRRAMVTDRAALHRRVDTWLADRSWDQTWSAIAPLLDRVSQRRVSVSRGTAWTGRFLAPGPSRSPASSIIPVAARSAAARMPSAACLSVGSSRPRSTVELGAPSSDAMTVGTER